MGCRLRKTKSARSVDPRHRIPRLDTIANGRQRGRGRGRAPANSLPPLSNDFFFFFFTSLCQSAVIIQKRKKAARPHARFNLECHVAYCSVKSTAAKRTKQQCNVILGAAQAQAQVQRFLARQSLFSRLHFVLPSNENNKKKCDRG